MKLFTINLLAVLILFTSCKCVKKEASLVEGKETPK
jgi:hypothetical protein